MTTTFLPKKRAICQVTIFLIGFLIPALTCAQHGDAQHGYRLKTQEISRKGNYYSRQSATIAVQKPLPLRVSPGFVFTSMSLRIQRSQNFTDAYIIAGTDTFYLQPDEHQPASDTLKQSNLVVFDKPQKQVLFVPGSINGEVAFSLINIGEEKPRRTVTEQQKQQAPKDSCGQPTVVPQSTWRDGLPAPSYQRVRTNVKHIIVHHSATYNDLTNYANVVKNIYLFHTIDRGWSDIGYNYLVAQDGTIFEGRSPGGQAIETDDIQGAHFCGQNSGTMGICMLGNYETAVPTEASLTSLKALIAWKVHQEDLDPFGQSYHPANSGLATIAGHRNGCSTECPGENLYARLGEIRTDVAKSITLICDPVAFNVYADPASHTLYISTPDISTSQQVLIYNMQGQRMTVPVHTDPAASQWLIDYTQLANGVYIVEVQGETFVATQKVLLLHSS